MVVELQKDGSVVLAHVDNKLHTSTLDPWHIIVLMLAATDGIEAVDYLSYHPDHPFGPVLMDCSLDCGLSDATAMDTIIGVVSPD